jgi:hypothetical protein
MKIPKKYLTSNPDVMKREIKKHGGKEDSDRSAYGPWDADYKSRKAGVGKKVKTKTSKYTKKYKEMFGENETPPENLDPNLVLYEDFELELEKAAYDVFIECGGQSSLEESSLDEKNSPVDKALKNKAKKTGFPLGILRQIFNRGQAAWKIGHIPGTTPQQWAMARVNSFVTGGKTTKMHDKALYQRAKAAKSKKLKEDEDSGIQMEGLFSGSSTPKPFSEIRNLKAWAFTKYSDFLKVFYENPVLMECTWKFCPRDDRNWFPELGKMVFDRVVPPSYELVVVIDEDNDQAIYAVMKGDEIYKIPIDKNNQDASMEFSFYKKTLGI